MLKTRMKRMAAANALAAKTLAEIELCIRKLEDDDLLDLADIFQGDRRGPLGELAAIEMARRHISL